MSESGLQTSSRLADDNLIGRVRRNHGLEHATLHILGGMLPRQPMAGHSDWNGFWILGNVSTETLVAAVEQALERLRNGEANLAVHPNCGTNYVTAGVLAGSVAGLVMLGSRRRVSDVIDRLPLAVTLATVALMVAQPLGLIIQERLTTSGIPGSLRVVDISQRRKRNVTVHRILTGG
jgi:hypothetical protein